MCLFAKLFDIFAIIRTLLAILSLLYIDVIEIIISQFYIDSASFYKPTQSTQVKLFGAANMVLLPQYCFPYPFTYVYHIFKWTNKLYKSQSYIHDVISSPWFALQLLLCYCYLFFLYFFVFVSPIVNQHYYNIVLVLCGTMPDNCTVNYFTLAECQI